MRGDYGYDYDDSEGARALYVMRSDGTPYAGPVALRTDQPSATAARMAELATTAPQLIGVDPTVDASGQFVGWGLWAGDPAQRELLGMFGLTDDELTSTGPQATPSSVRILLDDVLPLMLGRVELTIAAPQFPALVRLAAVAVTPNDPPGSPGATYFPVERVSYGGLLDLGNGQWHAFVWNRATGEDWDGPAEVRVVIYEPA